MLKGTYNDLKCNITVKPGKISNFQEKNGKRIIIIIIIARMVQGSLENSLDLG